MATIKDEQGNEVAKVSYKNPNINVDKIVSDIIEKNPEYTVVDAMERVQTEYAGGGKVGYSKIGMYKKGGKVKK